MPFDLTRFRAQLIGDAARPNLFQVILPFPSETDLRGDLGRASEKFSFFCRASQIPGATMGSVPVFYFGREIKIPGNKTFAEWTVTVFNDEDFAVRNVFERWMGEINSHRENLRADGMRQANDGYASDGRVIQYAKTGEIIRQYKLIGLWPMDISPIDLDWGANDSLEEWTATLAYQWWEVEGESAQSISTD
jgi:hypothetical protein